MKALPAYSVLTILLAAAPVQAASSGWFDTEGARVRLVTTGTPAADGTLKGILDIQLKPGWKTYWRDPGDAGVPPTLDVSASPNIASAVFDFPAPQRHDEGGFQWAGYDHPVALPVTFVLKDPAGPAEIDAGVFLGVCETICIPVQTTLAVDPASDPENPDDEAAVDAAFANIPPAATPEFGVKTAGESGGAKIVLEALFPGGAESAELYLAGEEGYLFATPAREVRDGKTFFSVEVTRPDEPATGAGIHYTLVTDAGAVSGLLPYF